MSGVTLETFAALTHPELMVDRWPRGSSHASVHAALPTQFGVDPPVLDPQDNSPKCSCGIDNDALLSAAGGGVQLIGQHLLGDKFEERRRVLWMR
jgi:hypothetical protein